MQVSATTNQTATMQSGATGQTTTQGLMPPTTTGGGAVAGVDLTSIMNSLLAAVQALQGVVQMLQAQLAGGAGVAGGGGIVQQGGGMAGMDDCATGGGIVQQGGGIQQYATGGGDPMQGMEMGDGHVHGNLPNPPARNDPRFLEGSTGPTVKKGKAPTIKIPDGPGFHGAKGRKQNDDDKSKNNYSVTDANFSNQLGLLAANPDNGKPLTYVQHIQMYAAANYLEAYAHPLYEKLIQAQNEGRGTILGAAAHIMGLVKTSDPAEAGLTAADLASVPKQIPGTPMDAKQYVASGKDITGQDWARPHHAGSQFKVMSQLIAQGLNWKDAMVLAGDDGISGSGRVNGVNGQNGKTGFNAGEKEIWSKAAELQQKTGIPIIQIMIGGHNHLGGDESALTNPAINKIIGFNKKDRGSSAARANAIYQVLLNGKVGNAKLAHAGGTNADNKGLLKYATGQIAPLQMSTSALNPNVMTTAYSVPQVATSTRTAQTSSHTS